MTNPTDTNELLKQLDSQGRTNWPSAIITKKAAATIRQPRADLSVSRAANASEFKRGQESVATYIEGRYPKGFSELLYAIRSLPIGE
jgi:hypothetical protein